MTKMDYCYATVAFCPNLTDPNATSKTVAVVIVAESDDYAMAVAVSRIPDEGLDEFTRTMLGDVPQFLKTELSGALGNLETFEPQAVLRSLRNALRNSLHVSGISENAQLAVEAVDEASVGLMRVGMQLLREQRTGGSRPKAPVSLPPTTASWLLDRRDTQASKRR